MLGGFSEAIVPALVSLIEADAAHATAADAGPIYRKYLEVLGPLVPRILEVFSQIGGGGGLAGRRSRQFGPGVPAADGAFSLHGARPDAGHGDGEAGTSARADHRN